MGKFKIILDIKVMKNGTTIEVSHSRELSSQDVTGYLSMALAGWKKSLAQDPG